MDTRTLTSHLILHYPTLKRYTVFFREGGAQNFDMEVEHLPTTLQNYISECERNGWVKTLSTKLFPSAEDSSGEFTIKVYSKAYDK